MAKLKEGGIGKIISDLIQKVDEIEAADLPQGDKTRKYKAAASKVKNELFLDKRKYGGKGVEKRITLNTYNAYITRIRKQFDDRLHHHFQVNVERLAARYPMFATELESWGKLPAASIRQRLGQLQNKLRVIIPLAEALSDIKSGPASEKKLKKLASKYPDWSANLAAMASDDWKEAERETHQIFQQGSRLLEDLNKLRVNHEILYHLQLSASERASIQTQWDGVLGEKKRNTVLLDYPTYMQRITDLIYAPFSPELIYQRQDMAPLAFALAAVSGRRMIEVMVQGSFEVVGRYEVIFHGQAKKRTGEDKGRKIYTLCDAKMFVQRLNELRKCPAAADFDEIRALLNDESYRAANVRIASILGNRFNKFAKEFFNDDRRTYKDSRSIYARIAYEAWFRHDLRWKNVDEDVFFAEILGHDDENTQLHYKQFKLHNFSRSWRPNTGVENKRLAALQALDNEMPAFAKGDAGVRIHEAVKQLVEDGGNVVINTNTLRKMGYNPTLVRRYLDFTADALGQAVGENGWLQNSDDQLPPIVLQPEEHPEDFEGDEEEEYEENEEDEPLAESVSNTNEKLPDRTQAEPRERPKFKAPKRSDDGVWVVEFTFQDKKYFWNGEAENTVSAMKAAWNNYF